MRSKTDMATGYRRIEAGWSVFGRDGERIGSVAAEVAEPGVEYFVLEKGMFFPSEHYIPFSAIDAIDDDEIHLSVSKEEIGSIGWDEPPTASDGDADLHEAVSGYQDRAVTPRDGATVDRREEHLRVDTEPVKTGEVRIGKRVVEEEQAVDVPVTREEVRISRRPVDRPASGDSMPDEITIPITEERATATTDARVVEEIDIEKVARQDTQRVTGTVKKEQFEIDGEDDASRR
jgi:uncharacterized protein (TIGR02271 family)